MSLKELFERLGAPLKNPRWSWGAARDDGVVFLRVWQDETRVYDGSRYVRVTHQEAFSDDPDNLGFNERLEHVDELRKGARCYLIMCQAEDPNALPRTIKDFNSDEVFPGGKVINLDNDGWVELRPRIPARDVVPPTR